MHYDQLKIKALELTENQLNQFMKVDGFKILDNRKFIESHIATLDAHRGNKNFMSFYFRLLDVVSELSSNIE